MSEQPRRCTHHDRACPPACPRTLGAATGICGPVQRMPDRLAWTGAGWRPLYDAPDPCPHDSLSGTGELGVRRCDSCPHTHRVVPDPDGPITVHPAGGQPYRARHEEITP